MTALTPQNVGYLPARVPCNGRLGFKKKTGPRREKTLVTTDMCPASLSHWRFIHQSPETFDCPHFTAEEPHDENHCPITQQPSILELKSLTATQGSPHHTALSEVQEIGLRRLTTLPEEEGLWNFRGRKCLFPAHNLFTCFLEKR